MGGLIIAGDRSGSGKTTVTMAILSALRSQRSVVQAFKVGPDYIDPMFHRAIVGQPVYNLDPVLTSESYVQRCFLSHSATTSYAVVEGVMGLFDGAGGTDYGSTAHVARLIHCPVLLVVDCARLSRSLAAIVHGYSTLDRRVNIVGVVLNRVGSDRHLAMLKVAMQSINMPILGVLRREDAITLPDRHLGLVPTDELSDLPQRFQRLAALGQRCFDWVALETIFEQSSFKDRRLAPETMNDSVPRSERAGKIRVGIARDRAFNFYYEDNLASLTRLDVELIPFSPLTDEHLPPDLNGLVLGGGFPEMFAEQLSRNAVLKQEIAHHIASGLPTYAECGGLMYLCQALTDFERQPWPMVGAIPARTTMTGKLTLGYRRVMVKRCSPLVELGQQFWGHEFHRSAIAPVAAKPLYQLTGYPTSLISSSQRMPEGWGDSSIHASYVHLHWGVHPELPKRFAQSCHSFMTKSAESTTR
ncbi:cobyrinate a,c-diamide synthase [Oscillatoria sp. CS-180]|uniref:cobyrinate a,c-diamide synthase n=1 Tax=Oscillatoria sp. CS-180 TaxID=3021720 RepID=UPI00232B33A4|nr:cobyrinate a,c-diamide synthase [Oscillatoria sp. CS-180]MDB9528413.1 cobyrinate a,c-diamide synthase [Oscillatoria sp. CS-180]